MVVLCVVIYFGMRVSFNLNVKGQEREKVEGNKHQCNLEHRRKLVGLINCFYKQLSVYCKGFMQKKILCKLWVWYKWKFIHKEGWCVKAAWCWSCFKHEYRQINIFSWISQLYHTSQYIQSLIQNIPMMHFYNSTNKLTRLSVVILTIPTHIWPETFWICYKSLNLLKVISFFPGPWKERKPDLHFGHPVFLTQRKCSFSCLNWLKATLILWKQREMWPFPPSIQCTLFCHLLNEFCRHSTYKTNPHKAQLTVKSSQVTFIYIAPLTIQIVTKQFCTISK